MAERGGRQSVVTSVVVAIAAAVVFAVSAAGCDTDSDEPLPEGIAAQHAEIEAQNQAEMTAITSRELVLLHPDSERQQRARQNLLYLQKHKDALGDPDEQDRIQRDGLRLDEFDEAIEAPVIDESTR